MDSRDYDYDRRPARSRKLNSFLSDVDQKRISQRRGEGSWKSRGGRGYGRSDGKRGGPGRPQHWDNMEKEGVPPKGEREERKEPLATPTESLTAPQDGSRKGVEEKSSSVGAKDAVEEWPDLQPNEGDGKGDQMGALQQGGGGGGGETGKDGPLGNSARANGTGSKEGPSKEGHESSKTGRQDDEMPSRLAGTRVGGHDDSAHREPNAGDSKRGAHWGNRGGGQRGNRHPNDGDQRQKWSKGRPEGQDRGGGGEKGDVRSGRKHDSLQGQGEREAYRREGHHPSEASQGKPRGGRGGRVTEGYKRNERAPASDQSNSHSVTTPPSGRVGEGPIPSLGRGERGAPREASDSGKPKSLFHTGETEGTKLTKVYSLSAEEGVARLSVMTSSNKGMGRGRGWKERLESPRKEEGGGGAPTLPTETVAASATREGGAQKTNIRVIESLEQRLSVGKTVTSLAARAIPPPVEPSSLVTSPPKDESEACREKGVVKSRGPGEEDTVEGAQVTKPKRYSSRRQQKAGENGDLLVGSEDVIPLGYGPHGNPMIPPMSWLNPNYYQPYLAHQMQQMKLMMSQPPMMMPQPPGMMSQPSGMMPQPPGVMEMGYPMPYMYWQPPPHSAAPLDSYPTMIPPPASVPIHGMEGEVGGPSYNPLPMGGGGYYMPPQVALDRQRASHSPSLPATAKPRSQAIPIVSPTPPQQQQDPPGEVMSSYGVFFES